MASWIEEKAAQIKQAQEKQEKDRQWQLHEAEVVRARGREILERIEAIVREDVELWNIQFPNDLSRRIDGVGKSPLRIGGFVVRRTHFPAVKVEVWLETDICYEVTKNRPIDGESYITKGRYHIKLSDRGDGLYLINKSYEHLSATNVAHQLLEPVLEEI